MRRRTFLKLIAAVGVGGGVKAVSPLSVAGKGVASMPQHAQRPELLGADYAVGSGFLVTCWYETGSDGEIRFVGREIKPLA